MTLGCRTGYSPFLLAQGYNPSLCYVMQFDGIGASTEKGVSGLKRVDDFQRVDKLSELWIGFRLQVPGTFPHDFDVTSPLSQGHLFLEGGPVDFLYGTVMVFVVVEGKAFVTSVP